MVAQHKGAHKGLGHIPDTLEELWIEIDGHCHLECSYCFANSAGIDTALENLTLSQRLDVIDQFIAAGGKRLGIPGAGEPFFHRNKESTLAILDHVKDTGIQTTIFTTGDTLHQNLIDRLTTYPDIVLLIKYNSAQPNTQDQLVNVQGYTKRRDDALARLIQSGFNDGNRLGLVTSILPENYEEMGTILRYARDHNIIFDSDTPIGRGRGESCKQSIDYQRIKQVIEELRVIDHDEYGNDWNAHGTYLASAPCTRFSQHLYVDKTGIVHPCVGSSKVVLGDVQEQQLQQIWNSPIMKLIRDHTYTGVCTTCENYQEQKCYSCLDRATQELTTQSIERSGSVETCGCFNYKKK